MAENKKYPFLHPLGESCLVTVENGKRVVMESVKRIVFCDGERVVLESKFSLEILGKGLSLKELGNGNMAVEGIVSAMNFSEL